MVIVSIAGFASASPQVNPASVVSTSKTWRTANFSIPLFIVGISHFFPALGLLSGLLVGKMVLVIVGFMTFRSSVNTEKGWRFVNTLFSLLVIWNSTLILRLFHVA